MGKRRRSGSETETEGIERLYPSTDETGTSRPWHGLPHHHSERPPALLFQRGGDDFLVVPGIDVFVGTGRMRPDHCSATGVVGGFQEFEAAQLFVLFGCQLGVDHVAGVVEEQELAAVVAE